MNSDERQIYIQALRTFGASSQLAMAQEECAELIVELAHHKRGRNNLIDITQEVADVEIMMGQLRVLLGDANVDLAKEHKLDRLKKRLEAFNEDRDPGAAVS